MCVRVRVYTHIYLWARWSSRHVGEGWWLHWYSQHVEKSLTLIRTSATNKSFCCSVTDSTWRIYFTSLNPINQILAEHGSVTGVMKQRDIHPVAIRTAPTNILISPPKGKNILHEGVEISGLRFGCFFFFSFWEAEVEKCGRLTRSRPTLWGLTGTMSVSQAWAPPPPR